MSVRIMNLIWETQLSPVEKLVFLCYADRAHENGTSIFPSKRNVAQRCNLNLRTVFRHTKNLVEKGYLIPIGLSQWGTMKYWIDVSWLEKEIQNIKGHDLSSGKDMVNNHYKDGLQPPKSSLTINKPSYRYSNNGNSRTEYIPKVEKNIQKLLAERMTTDELM